MPNGGAPGVPSGTEAGAAGVPLGEFALLDVDRRRRTGVPEVVFGEGKTSEQIFTLLAELRARDPEGPALATRCPAACWTGRQPFPSRSVDADHVAGTVGVDPAARARNVLVVTAGTTDLKIARMCRDAGHARRPRGISSPTWAWPGRTAPIPARRPARRRCIIVVTGWTAPCSIVAGLVSAPVIGLPTMYGYSIAAAWRAARSCSPHAAQVLIIVNIDNSSARHATKIIRAVHRDGPPRVPPTSTRPRASPRHAACRPARSGRRRERYQSHASLGVPVSGCGPRPPPGRPRIPTGLITTPRRRPPTAPRRRARARRRGRPPPAGRIRDAGLPAAGRGGEGGARPATEASASTSGCVRLTGRRRRIGRRARGSRCTGGPAYAFAARPRRRKRIRRRRTATFPVPLPPSCDRRRGRAGPGRGGLTHDAAAPTGAGPLRRSSRSPRISTVTGAHSRHRGQWPGHPDQPDVSRVRHQASSTEQDLREGDILTVVSSTSMTSTGCRLRVLAALRAAGAWDCWCTPTVGRHGRQAGPHRPVR